jgi:hypothetical protein
MLARARASRLRFVVASRVAEPDFMSSSGEDRSELPPINLETRIPIRMLLLPKPAD